MNAYFVKVGNTSINLAKVVFYREFEDYVELLLEGNLTLYIKDKEEMKDFLTQMNTYEEFIWNQ